MKAKILVVEDERLVALDIAKRLEKKGYNVLATVATASEAIEKVRETLPDLILIDIHLKGETDGIQVAEKMRLDFDIPVIYLTAYTDEDTLQRAKMTEPYGYIVKPFDEKELNAVIEVALHKHLTESSIRSALKKEQQISQLKSRFWSMVAHEFRTPMTTVLCSAQLLELHSENSDFKDEKRQEFLFLIQKAISSMNQLLDDILALGKLEEGRLEVYLEPIDLSHFCEQMVAEIKVIASANHQIIFNQNSECPIAYLDRKLMRHIINNLLVNAIKYSPSGGNIYLELSSLDDKAILKVKDSGIGIPEANLKNIGEAFRRADNVGTIPGTGLGLTMVKKCLDLQGGDFHIDSAVGVGTNITIKLPLNQ